MSSTTDFIAELIKAANEVEKLSSDERARLLRRASHIVRKLHSQTDARKMRKKDTLRSLEIAALRAEHGSNADAKTVLLETAETIRTLKMAVDEKVGGLRGA